MKKRLALRVPKGLPPVYHPFDGDGKSCAYCNLPRKVHPEQARSAVA